jgi:hypothetical protein
VHRLLLCSSARPFATLGTNVDLIRTADDEKNTRIIRDAKETEEMNDGLFHINIIPMRIVVFLSKHSKTSKMSEDKSKGTY